MNTKKNILIASDHGGWTLKEEIKKHFTHLMFKDIGPQSGDTSVDYPDFADSLCKELITEPQLYDCGILICGSGQGMAMRANKYQNIRAALVWNEESTRLAREHNDANVLCLGGRLLTTKVAFSCIEIFLKTDFAGGRHSQRIEKLNGPTERFQNDK